MYITLSDANLYYESKGTGVTVILIHAHSVDSRMWDAQFDSLAEKYFVIRYDLRGYGKSSLPDPRVHYRHVDDLVAIMHALDVKQAHLVGLSLGSMVALDCLALYPERVLSAACASSGLYAGEFEPWPDDELELQEQDFVARPIALDDFKKEWMTLMMQCSGLQKDRIYNELETMISEWSAWQILYERKRPLVGSVIESLLHKQSEGPPLLVIIGELDSEGSRNSSGRLLDLISNAEKVLIAGAGHFSNMESPKAFNSVLINFISS
ncbi:alpha/beta fold hydrolase [Paenibacillus monticola]|uniref:Alpha/beta fold hydrolase n=1 Tax=Paenibacillus monticola TaxID=2666075 RepID=A0A7X2L2M0_9BACL|nr:alpha/beta hydrolase [Paenibacillus monticola]MRN55027.1 alpha/beta fold hydrolase [Paenibacillus monticola]